MHSSESIPQKEIVGTNKCISIQDRLYILLISCESKDVIKRDNFPTDLELFQWATQDRHDIHIVNVYAQEPMINIADVDGIILWWSSSSAYENIHWISNLKELIKTIHTHNIPLLWCCFWSHVIADALWWVIWKWVSLELWVHKISLTKNWQKDPLFYDLPDEIDVIMSHKDDVFSIGDLWTRLAYNATSFYQGFSFWTLIKWLQFHPEYTIDTLNKMEKIYGITKTSNPISYTWKQIIDNFLQHIVYKNKYWAK